MADTKPIPVPEPIPAPILKKMYSVCSRCNGATTYSLPLGDVSCDKCNGTGMVLTGYMEV